MIFQIIGITESKLKGATPPTTSITLSGYNYEHMPTKSANGRALPYNKNDINYKLRPDLNINKDKELGSIFIETPIKIFLKYYSCLYLEAPLYTIKKI